MGTETSLTVTVCPASAARTVKSPGCTAPRATPLPSSSPVMRRSGGRPLKVAWAQRCPCTSPSGTARESVFSGRKSWVSTARLGLQRSSTLPTKDSCASSSDSSPRVTSSSRPPGDRAPSTARPASASGGRPLPRSTSPWLVRSWNSASRRRVFQESSRPSTSARRPPGSCTRISAPRTSRVPTSSRSSARSGHSAAWLAGAGCERSSQSRGRTSRTCSSSRRPVIGCTPATVTSRASALKSGRSFPGAPAESP